MKIFTCLVYLFFMLGHTVLGQSAPSSINVGGTVQASSNPNNLPNVVGGTFYTADQTVFLNCSQSTILVAVPISHNSSGDGERLVYWTATGGYSLTDTQLSSVKILNFDPNGGPGELKAAYLDSGGLIRIYLRQKPDAPTFTSLPPACLSSGQTGTSSATVSYPFQNNNPLQLVWQGSGGVTINGSNTYLQTNVGANVNVQNSSYGRLSVSARIPGCNNIQSDATSTYIGPAHIGDVAVDNVLNPGPVSVSAGSTHYIHTTAAYNYNPAFSLGTSTNSGNMSLSLSGVNNGDAQIYVSGSVGNASVNITASNSCGSNSRSVTFYIPYSYRIASNPAKNNLSVTFTGTENEEALPDQLNIVSEKTAQTVRSVDIKSVYEKKAFQESSVNFDIKELPRGTYYLKVINSRLPADQQVDTIRLIFE